MMGQARCCSSGLYQTPRLPSCPSAAAQSESPFSASPIICGGCSLDLCLADVLQCSCRVSACTWPVSNTHLGCMESAGASSSICRTWSGWGCPWRTAPAPCLVRRPCRSATWQSSGRWLAPHLAGVTVTEAVKDAYAALPLGPSRTRRVVLGEAA